MRMRFQIQLEKAPFPIFVTESGMITDISPVQYENAQSPISVIPSGIITEVKFFRIVYASYSAAFTAKKYSVFSGFIFAIASY